MLILINVVVRLAAAEYLSESLESTLLIFSPVAPVFKSTITEVNKVIRWPLGTSASAGSTTKSCTPFVFAETITVLRLNGIALVTLVAESPWM